MHLLRDAQGGSYEIENGVPSAGSGVFVWACAGRLDSYGHGDAGLGQHYVLVAGISSSTTE